MTKPEEIHTVPVDVQNLTHGIWVHIECRKHDGTAPDGIYGAGGSVVGLFHGFGVCYQGDPVVAILDPVLHEKPFLLLPEDIISVEKGNLSVLND